MTTGRINQVAIFPGVLSSDNVDKCLVLSSLIDIPFVTLCNIPMVTEVTIL